MASTNSLSRKIEQNGVVSPSNNEAHAKLIAELQGQVMHVPNMLSLFPTWPSGGRNKYYKRLKARLDEIVASVYPDEASRRRAGKNDFAFFASIWYPEVEYESLFVAGIFSYWIFAFDDLMDANDEDLSMDLSASARYREQTLDYTRYWLGLEPLKPQTSTLAKLSSWLLPASRGEKGEKGWSHALLSYLGIKSKREPVAPNLPCSTFKEFGQAVHRNHSKAFREGLAKELKDYFDHCEIEQKERLTGKTSVDFDSYVAIRYYTSAVRIYCYITQITYGIEIPQQILDSPEMQALWKEVDINIIIGNDVLSVKKELAAGCVHNAVPVLYHQGRPLDAVIPELMRRLETCRDRFDEAAVVVQKVCSKESEKVQEDLVKYIDGLRTIATGTIDFCKIAERYGLTSYFNDDEAI
ncbi:isoprenoid synthase domain-containing protein [Lasiosphaeria hispida]|uniref:Terpene synthase n=1 Tax=Lasiosphaeria hispida TaxID=260671 RepID=A0AAJ0MFC3_9PEZI|nr:isoprenoid synthase domain-containing protein [Lasiosphaeria hispida]